MRVAYVCADPGVPVFGSKGASVHVQAVVRELVRRGAIVQVFCARAGGPPPADLRGVLVHETGVPQGDAVRQELALMAANTEMARLLGAHGPFDLVYERYSLWSRSGMSHAWSSAIPSVLEVNAPLIEEQAEHRTLVHRAAALQVLNSVLAEADSVVCVAEPVAEWVRSHAPDRDRVHVIPNGVDLTRITPAPEPLGEFTVGFLGTLKPWHGVDVLLTAASAVEGLRVLLVGDGPERRRLLALADDLGISDRVEFTGAVPPGAVAGQLSRMHVAAAPYPDVEGYFSPLKVFEYLAAGLPLVASRHGQLLEVLTHDEDALLVPPGDAAALYFALRELRDDQDLRTRLRVAARRTASRHSWASTVDRILDTVAIRTVCAEPVPAKTTSANLRPARARQGVA